MYFDPLFVLVPFLGPPALLLLAAIRRVPRDREFRKPGQWATGDLARWRPWR